MKWRVWYHTDHIFAQVIWREGTLFNNLSFSLAGGFSSTRQYLNSAQSAWRGGITIQHSTVFFGLFLTHTDPLGGEESCLASVREVLSSKGVPS